MTHERLEAIKDHVINGKRVEALAQVDAALADGVEAKRVMLDALIPAMASVGEKYSSGEFFLPQVMIAAKAMSEAMARIGPHLVRSGYRRKGKAVIGTVAGSSPSRASGRSLSAPMTRTGTRKPT